MEIRPIPIKGLEDIYSINEYGEIKTKVKRHSYAADKIRSHSLDRNGYHFFQFYQNGKRKSIPVHELVIRAFVGEPPQNGKVYVTYEVNHIDGNPHNNHYSNLEWVTHKENVIKSFNNPHKERKVAKGSESPMSHLTQEDVKEIRRLAARFVPRRIIGDRFNISHVAVTYIVNRKTWTHID